MTDRDAIYIQILHFGLCHLRDAALGGYTNYCAVEADHLHNLPSLVGESNERRHDYYFDKERSLYLERVDREIPGVNYVLKRYEEQWAQLAELRDRP